MSQSQTAINAKAARWLADLLEHNGIADAQQRAEHITRELIAQGLAPVPKPIPIRPAGPVASPEAVSRYLAEAAAAIEAKKRARQDATTTPAPTHEETTR